MSQMTFMASTTTMLRAVIRRLVLLTTGYRGKCIGGIVREGSGQRARRVSLLVAAEEGGSEGNG